MRALWFGLALGAVAQTPPADLYKKHWAARHDASELRERPLPKR